MVGTAEAASQLQGLSRSGATTLYKSLHDARKLQIELTLEVLLLLGVRVDQREFTTPHSKRQTMGTGEAALISWSTLYPSQVIDVPIDSTILHLWTPMAGGKAEGLNTFLDNFIWSSVSYFRLVDT